MKRQGIYNHKRPRKQPDQVKESNLDLEIIMGNSNLIREVSVGDDPIYGFLPLGLVEGYGIRISSGWGPQWTFRFIFFEYIIGRVARDHIGLPDVHQECLFLWFEKFNEMDGPLKAHMIGPVIDRFIQPEGLYYEVVRIEELSRRLGDFRKI